VEEKQLLAALAEAGLPATALAPASLALPFDPTLPPVPLPPAAADLAHVTPLPVVVDRCADRAVGAAVLPLWRALGVTTLDAGLAATGNRAAVAVALAPAGVPRPATRLVCSEAAALAALDQTGYPATLLPLAPDAAPVPLLDRDTAEAVLEHRAVLGGASAVVALIQTGAPRADERITVMVVGGRTVAVAGDDAGPVRFARLCAIAEAAATAIGAAVAGVEIAMLPGGAVVWDIVPVPDFRGVVPIGRRGVAEAIAALALGRFTAGAEVDRLIRVALSAGEGVGTAPGRRQGVSDGVALTA
ncbi:MAG: hypothetical protein M3Q71_17425, partial [Chloroflexota bacterium]|nr:hypothetical protein [Chloroflexota bacterium]